MCTHERELYVLCRECKTGRLTAADLLSEAEATVVTFSGVGWGTAVEFSHTEHILIGLYFIK